LKYYLDTIYQHLVDLSSGSARSNLSQEVLQKVKIPFPDLPTQLRIAAILGSIDEKIELNRKKIAELEALAKTIYDYLFVQFDFPDKNGKPYKSSGGKMVWNEQLKREIPDGWEEWSIHKSGSFHRGISYSKQDEITKGLNSVSVYRGNNISNGFVVDDSNEVFIPKNMVAESHMLQRGQVLIAMSSGSKEHVGKTGLVTNTCPNCAFGAFCTAFEPIDEYKFLIYDFFRSFTYRAYINQICSGTGINNLKFEHFETALFAVPGDQEILKSFNAIQEPLYNQIMRLDEESSILKNTRNYLLPLLMNGQVEVKE
jgi:type I restriction enzyme S subunit